MCHPTSDLPNSNPASYIPPPKNHDWEARPICIPNEDGMQPINLMDCYRDSVTAMNTWVKKLKSENRVPGIALPASLYPPQWDQRKKIIQTIQIAARDQGMMLPLAESLEGEHIYLRCQRGYLNFRCRKTQPIAPEPDEHGIQSAAFKPGVKSDTYVNKSNNSRGPDGICMCRRYMTDKPPKKEDRCEFSIKLALLPGRCWYIPYRHSKYRRHIKHPDLPPHLQNVRTNYMTDKEKKTAQIVSKHSSGAVAQNIVTELGVEEHGNRFVFTDQQLRYLRTKAAACDFGEEGEAGQEYSNSERLIDALDKKVAEKKIRYVALYHKVTATSLLAISKAQQVEERKKQKLSAAKEQMVAEGRNPDDLSHKELEALKELNDRERLEVAGDLVHKRNDLFMQTTCHKDEGQVEEEPYVLETIKEKLSFGSALMSVREKLRVNDKIMIGSAWSREDECTLFEKFPEIFMFDVTCKTNNEKRPFGVGAGMDGDMNTFTPIRVFMPSQCGWVFNWIFGSAMPALFGADLLDRIQIFLTDGDKQMYKAFENNKRHYYRHARHNLCMFHLVVQGLNAIKGKMKGLDTKSVRKQLETFKQFLYSWMRVGEVESEEEYAESKACLETWLTRLQNTHTSEAVRHNVSVLSDFLTNKILPHKERWLACLRQDNLTLHQRTTSALEGINQTIKYKSKDYVQPTMGMAESFECQMRQCDAKMDKYHKKVWSMHSSYCPYVAGSKTADEVYRRCESEIHRNEDQRQKYHVRKVDDHSIELLQRFEDDATPIFCLECNSTTTCGPCSEMSPIPRFRRIRTLTFHPVGDVHGSYIVTCTCPYYTTFGIPCRHFTVFSQVQLHHLIIRHRLDYNALYLGEEGFATEEQNQYFKRKQRDMRLIITKEEYERIMQIAWAKERTEDNYLFESPRSMMFQRNKEGMLAFTRPATGDHYSVDDRIHKDTYATTEMTEETRLPAGAVTPSPTRTHSATTPLLNGAHDVTKNVLSMFDSVRELYKDLPRHLDKIANGLVQFLGRAIEKRQAQIGQDKPREEESGERHSGESRGEKRKVKDMYEATDRCVKSTRLKPAHEVKRKKARQSRKTSLSIHSQCN